jgi:DMSO/TMAO reductase YedYZ heme-binding membrane subunit
MKATWFLRWVAGVIWVALLVEAVLVWTSCRGDGHAYTRGWALTRSMGWTGFVALCAALCITPAAKLISAFVRVHSGWTRELRRAFGLAAGSAAFAHACAALVFVPGTRGGLFGSTQVRSGVAALLVLVLLYLTSFRSIVRRLRLQFWKELHRVAYVAVVLALVHVLHAAFVPMRAALLVVAVTFVLGLSRLLRNKQIER